MSATMRRARGGLTMRASLMVVIGATDDGASPGLLKLLCDTSLARRALADPRTRANKRPASQGTAVRKTLSAMRREGLVVEGEDGRWRLAADARAPDDADGDHEGTKGTKAGTSEDASVAAQTGRESP